jgi:predicted DNA-binding transcriptional regulator AlpA
MTQTRYWDIHELAEVLEISAGSIRRRLKRAPWELPAQAHLGPNFPIRWRKQEVEAWLFERSFQVKKEARSSLDSDR